MQGGVAEDKQVAYWILSESYLNIGNTKDSCRARNKWRESRAKGIRSYGFPGETEVQKWDKICGEFDFWRFLSVNNANPDLNWFN